MKVAAIVTTGQPSALLDLLGQGTKVAVEGSQVRMFFRDESVPALCVEEVAERLGWPELRDGTPPTARAVGHAIESASATNSVVLYVCTSSMYIWGITAADLRPGVKARGLIAFLAEDLAGADDVWCV